VNQKKKRNGLICILVLVIIICSAAGGAYLYFNNMVSKIKHVDISSKSSDLGITTNDDNNYINILLLGIDTRDYKTDPGRSDATIILTIDKKHKAIKITSLLRDMVMDNLKGQGPMAGKNQDRLNHAFAYGGPLLSIKTVNQNFNLNIKDYIKVDFIGFEKIIDAIGGVSINVSKEEIPIANDYINEVSKLENKAPNHITKSGLQNLTGIQALGYSRIRYVGNGDFERTERQRIVLDAVFKKLSTKSLLAMPALANTISPYMETSLSQKEIFDIGSFVITNHVKTFKQNRLPIDGAYKIDYSINNVYFVVWDKKKNIDELHKFIYEEDAAK
jgi:polyisoprenyl-teichoic acid--peptidoglycan teichoic acid transferase